MATLTPILGLAKPIVGADDDVWGGMWNANADILDGLVKPIDLAPYLLKAGGTMTGFLTLSANAANALHAVPLQQMQAGLATKIGDAPNDGGYYARRNLAWEPSPGSAINQDAPSDGFAYGRRNASWDKTLRLLGGTMTGDIVLKGDATAALNPVSLQQLNTKAGAYLPLTGGVVAGATTINGNVFAATTGHITGLRMVAPPADATRSIWQMEELAFEGNAGHLAWNGYISSTAGPVWRALKAGPVATIYQASGGNLNFVTSPSVAAGSTLAPGGVFNMNADGSFTASSAITSGTTVTSGTHIYCNGTLSINPANSWEWYFSRDGNGNHIENHRANWWTQWATANGTWSWNSPSGGCMTLDGSGNFWARSGVQSPWIYSTGQVRGDASVVSYGPVVSYSGRVSAEHTGEPAVFCHRPGYFAAGMLVNSANSLIFANVDGNGVWQKTYCSFDTTGNFWGAAAVTCSYVHSTGSIQADGDSNASGNMTCQRMRATNGVMSVNGAFYVADNNLYYLARNGGTGQWDFVEGGTSNFAVQTNGDTQQRGTSYQANAFCRGQLWVANDWNTQFGAGGSGRILQFTASYYWDYNAGNGEVAWLSAGGGMFKQRNTDWLGWNQTGPIGGIGAYQNYSDARGKTDIAHTEIGLPEIMKMQPARFTRVIDPKWAIGRKFPDGRPQPDFIPRSEIGFIAQELQDALPEAVVEVENVTGDGEARLMMTLDPIVAALVNAVKTLNGRLVKLEGRH